MLYVNNLDVTQSRQANDSASIAKRAKKIKSQVTCSILIIIRKNIKMAIILLVMAR